MSFKKYLSEMKPKQHVIHPLNKPASGRATELRGIRAMGPWWFPLWIPMGRPEITGETLHALPTHCILVSKMHRTRTHS